MIDISLAAKLAKNSLSDTGSWLVFLDIANKDKSIEFKIVSNTEDITRNSVVHFKHKCFRNIYGICEPIINS